MPWHAPRLHADTNGHEEKKKPKKTSGTFQRYGEVRSTSYCVQLVPTTSTVAQIGWHMSSRLSIASRPARRTLGTASTSRTISYYGGVWCVLRSNLQASSSEGVLLLLFLKSCRLARYIPDRPTSTVRCRAAWVTPVRPWLFGTVVCILLIPGAPVPPSFVPTRLFVAESFAKEVCWPTTLQEASNNTYNGLPACAASQHCQVISFSSTITGSPLADSEDRIAELAGLQVRHPTRTTPSVGIGGTQACKLLRITLVSVQFACTSTCTQFKT